MARLLLIFLIALGIGAAQAHASLSDSLSVEKLVTQQLSKNFTGARIELLSPIRWTAGVAQSQPNEISSLSENGRGEATFAVVGVDGVSQGAVAFAAWVPAWVAIRRTLPGERIIASAFNKQPINVATGMAHEYRGVMMTDSEIEGLQSRQTIMEGQSLLSSAVERVPDIRRGDVVRILMNSGDLQLSTQGTAEEPGYLNNQIRVMTKGSKRELVGQLESGGVVEVKL